MSSNGIPGATARGPVVSKNILAQIAFARRFMRDALTELETIFDTYGETVLLQVGDIKHYFFSNPEHIQDIVLRKAASFHKDRDYKDPNAGLARFLGNGLLTSDGEFWKRQRRLVAPALHTRRIEAYADTMVQYTQDMLRDWARRTNSTIDVAEEMTQLTLLIVGKTLFNADVKAAVQQVGAAVEVIQHAGGVSDMIPKWVPLPAHLRERRVLRELNELVYGIIRERRASGGDSGDLLSMLLLAQDDDGSHMTDQQVRDEFLTLFLAGHETTSNTLNWTWMLLAQHPQAEAKLHAELDTVLAGRAPTLQDLQALPYTEMVIKESLRLYPPAWGFGRMAIEDVQVGEYAIPNGASVGVSVYRTHRDPRWWDNPHEFRPERFSPENEAAIPRYAYLPFGGGPRICIGNSFAMMEARLLLAAMAQHYQLRLAPGQVVKPEAHITMYPRGGLPMRLEARVPVVKPEAVME